MAAAEETAAGSSPLSSALPEETYNDMPQEAQEALDELGEWDITPDCRRDYARRMSHYSTYLQDNGMEGLLRDDSDEQLPDKLLAHCRGSKTKFWPNRIDYKNISYKNFRAYCAQARKSVKGGTPGETQLCSHTDVRKMKDSLLCHLRIVGVIPPPPFPASFVPKRPPAACLSIASQNRGRGAAVGRERIWIRASHTEGMVVSTHLLARWKRQRRGHTRYLRAKESG